MHRSTFFLRSMLGIGLVWLTTTWSFAGGDAAAPVAEVALPTMRGPNGQIVDLTAPQGGLSALIFYSSECPISNAYSPMLNRLREEFPTESVKIVGVCVDPDLSSADMLAHAKDFDLKFPVVHDRRGSIATKLGAAVTPEAFVIDERGPGSLPRPDRRPVRRASEEEREPEGPRAARRDRRRSGGTRGGARSRRGRRLPDPEARRERRRRPTYSGEVASILQKNCQECHRTRPGRPLRARDLRAGPQACRRHRRRSSRTGGCPPGSPTRTSARSSRMTVRCRPTRSPRWPPGPRPGPAGRPRAAPPAPAFPDEWTLGTPDLVLELAEDFSIPATGDDIYRCFVIPTDLPEDVYISAIEYQPGNRRVVHHMLSYVDISGEGRKKDDGRSRPGLLVLLRAGGRDPRRPRRLGPRQRAEPPPRGDRPVAAPQGRRHHAGPLPPERQARDRPLADRPPLLPDAGQADPALERRHQVRPEDSPRRVELSRSRPPGPSPSTSRPGPSPPTCTCSGTT